jgi:transposase-like protein
MKSSKALRTAILRHRERHHPKAPRYTPELKRAVVEFVRSQRSAGVSYEALVRTLELPINTLRRWTESDGPGRLARVEVAAEASHAVLLTRTGIRVEGLTITDLAELLERLS